MESKQITMSNSKELFTSSNNSQSCEFHTLSDKWVLYAHLPHDTNWKIDSYKFILKLNTVEEALGLFETIPDIMVNNCMLFMMRENIKPIWEDKKNCKGGSFSFKVLNKNLATAWRNLCYSAIGETLSNDETFMKNVNGITVSPKRNFCIVKIWMKTCEITNVNSIIDIDGIDKNVSLFKKHTPEY